MEKIAIYTESKFLPEKNYVFKVIFEEILGITYEVFDTSVSQVYKIVLPNEKFIEFADDFFTYIPESIGYCKKAYLPQKVWQLKNDFGEPIPFFYGSNRYTDHGKSIYCGLDIIGNSFFMLSRWEEMIADKKDKHGRFPEEDACAVKFGLIQKPLVHIYAEFLRRLFQQFGYEIPVKHKYKKILTHDIDYLYKWGTRFDYVKNCIGDICKRFSIKSLKTTMNMYKNGQDPYDTYQYLMDLSEQNGQKSLFYFLKSKKNDFEIITERGQKIIQSIIARGHNVAIHSNYFLEGEWREIQADKEYYERIFSKKIEQNRQHYLKVNIPQTFRLLEENGISQDSSLYYSHHLGFRTGMCIEHSLFDCERRRILKLKELPLTLMDISLQNARKYDEAVEMVDTLIETVKKYNGTFVCLWHNSSFNSPEWRYLAGIYEHIVEAK